MAKPSTGNTKMVHIRISPELWAALERMAARRKTTISEVARQELWHATLREALTLSPAADAERVA